MKSGEYINYRGKHFDVPALSPGFILNPQTEFRRQYPILPKSGVKRLRDLKAASYADLTAPILEDLNTTWNLERFKTPRRPIHVAFLESDEERQRFSKPGAVNVLDLPIKFPGSEFRIPAELEQFYDVIVRVIQFEKLVNGECFDEYYCYASVDQRPVKAGTLQREAPCHVDGFQGAKWNPKVRINHTYVISDTAPTTYYPQPFNFDGLDEAKHNFFWEMNRQVALNNSQYVWQPQSYELNMIDAYTVHRGTPVEVDCERTWLRLSFEVRIFNRLGNAHNPMFSYDWEMIPRDIEGLNLVAWDPNSDPSLRVFPWQKLDGSAHEDRHTRTQPNLKRS